MRYLVGIKAVQQLLEHAPERVKGLFFDPQKKATAKLVELAAKHGISAQKLDAKKLDQKAEGANHQGIMASYAYQDLSLGDLIDTLESKDQALVVVLDEVQDPQNVGAILRTCAAFGVDAIIAPNKNACGLTPTVVKAAQGGDLWVPFIQVVNLSRALKQLQESGIWVVGTHLSEQAKPLHSLDLTGKLALVMGAEGEGLRANTLNHCDFQAIIPMASKMGSLNVSVATGICLWEAMKQRSTA